MTYPSEQQQYDHDRYLRQREKRLEQRRAYYYEYEKKGLRKPRQRTPRSIRDHERYMEHRDEILARQKIYRETHKEEIKRRRRERGSHIYVMKNYERRTE